jgi:hypothetical protein
LGKRNKYSEHHFQGQMFLIYSLKVAFFTPKQFLLFYRFGGTGTMLETTENGSK